METVSAIPIEAVEAPAASRWRARVVGLARLWRRPAPWLVLGMVAAVVLLERWVRSLGGPDALLERFGAGAPIAMVGIQAALATAPVPSELFALASASAYGWAIGAVMTWAGWTLGAMAQYAIARSTGRGARASLEPVRLPRFLARFSIDHPVILVCVRWLPMGSHFANITAGVRRVPVWRQLWTAALGAVPGAIVWAGIGAGVSLI